VRPGRPPPRARPRPARTRLVRACPVRAGTGARGPRPGGLRRRAGAGPAAAPCTAAVAQADAFLHRRSAGRSRRHGMNASVKLRRRPADTGGDWPEAVPALLRRIYRARGAASLSEARPRLAQMLPPTLLGLDAAARLLADAIAQDRHVLVVGDFDCA